MTLMDTSCSRGFEVSTTKPTCNVACFSPRPVATIRFLHDTVNMVTFGQLIAPFCDDVIRLKSTSVETHVGTQLIEATK